jgi:SET domain-containing protein
MYIPDTHREPKLITNELSRYQKKKIDPYGLGVSMKNFCSRQNSPNPILLHPHTAKLSYWSILEHSLYISELLSLLFFKENDAHLSFSTSSESDEIIESLGAFYSW